MTPVIIRPLPAERRVSYSAAWFAPVDLVTGLPPTLPMRVLLDIRHGQAWEPTGIAPTITLSGAVAYPDLGRRATRRPRHPSGTGRGSRRTRTWRLAAPTGTARSSSPTHSTTPPRRRRPPPR